MSKLLNSIGLIMDMAGVLLMYFNTPLHSRKPQSSHDPISEGSHYLFGGRQLERKEWKLIRIGFWLIGLGFLGQLVSGFLR